MMNAVTGSLGAMRINRELITRVSGGSTGRFRSAMPVMQDIVTPSDMEATQRA